MAASAFPAGGGLKGMALNVFESLIIFAKQNV
jgi:hypothetical protein